MNDGTMQPQSRYCRNCGQKLIGVEAQTDCCDYDVRGVTQYP